FSQIVESDLVLLAAPSPCGELARRGAQRLLRVQYIRSGADLFADYRVDLRIVTVELGKLGRNIARRLDRTGTEIVLNGDERCAGGCETCWKRQKKNQPHRGSPGIGPGGLCLPSPAGARTGQSRSCALFCRLPAGRPSGTPAARRAACWRAASSASSKSS